MVRRHPWLHTYDVVPGKIAFLTSDLEQSHEVALISVGADAPGPEKGRVGLNHTGWQMHSLDDLKEFYHRAKAKGVEIDFVADHAYPSASTSRTPMATA